MIRTRPLTPTDLPFLWQLKQQAGWNQTREDLARFLALEPAGGFVAELAGRPAGSTLTFRFGPVAWVAMVLVEESLRGRGVGTALMEHALTFLEARGVRTVRLDATPLGRPVYEKLGFVAEYALTRYGGTLPEAGPVPGVEPARPDELEEVARLDRDVTGADRAKMLHLLYAERPEALRVVRRDGRLVGYLTARPGSAAVHVGPCLAEAAGPLLLADACHRLAGRPAFLDVPDGHRAAVAFVAGRGLKPLRPLLRMSRGAPAAERVEALWASSGPEKG